MRPTMVLVKSIALEVCGFAPHESVAIKHLEKKDNKSARKLIRRRLGSCKASVRKLNS